MERIEDEDMAPRWAEHYPRRQDSVISKALCLTICRIIENNVARNSSDDGLFDNIHRALVALGIPKDEFYNVEKESGDK